MRLDVREEGCVVEAVHYVHRAACFESAQDGPELAVGVGEREEAEPALGGAG